MVRVVAALSLLLAACPAAAIEKRKTVYLDRMAGFERHIRAAIREAMVNVTIIDESVQPDYRMFLDPRFRSVHAEIMYRKATGRSENAVLELYDVRAGRALIRYSFKLTADEDAQRKAAREFVAQMRKQLNLKAGGKTARSSEPRSGAEQ